MDGELELQSRMLCSACVVWIEGPSVHPQRARAYRRVVRQSRVTRAAEIYELPHGAS